MIHRIGLDNETFPNLSSYKAILVDMTYIVWRSSGAHASLSSPTGDPTQIIFISLKTISKLLQFSHGSVNLLLVWDSPKSWRKVCSAKYKSDREGMDSGDWDQVLQLRTLLSQIGIYQVMTEGYEGDDWLAYANAMSSEPTLIVTGDRDLFQLVSDKKPTHLLYSGGDLKNQIIDEQMASQLFIHPSLVTSYKTLVGDAGDCVSGVRGIGDVYGRKLIQEYGRVDDWLFGDNIPNLEDAPPDLKRPLKLVFDRKSDAIFSHLLVNLEQDMSPDAYDILNEYPSCYPDLSSAKVTLSNLGIEEDVTIERLFNHAFGANLCLLKLE